MSNTIHAALFPLQRAQAAVLWRTDTMGAYCQVMSSNPLVTWDHKRVTCKRCLRILAKREAKREAKETSDG